MQIKLYLIKLNFVKIIILCVCSYSHDVSSFL
jgi:hypothetical protein